jgi:hypothetical protein
MAKPTYRKILEAAIEEMPPLAVFSRISGFRKKD